LPDTLRITVSPDIIRQDTLVSLINSVANRLADKMSGNSIYFESVFGKSFSFFAAIYLICFIDFKVITPAGKLQSIIAK
jgi:hypothetical protein